MRKLKSSEVDDPVVKRILYMMEQRGISQKDMAAKLGISNGSFSKWKTEGSKSYNRHLEKLSEILNAPVSFFVSGEIDGDKKKSEDMYSENTRTMIRLFEELDEDEQEYFIGTLNNFKRLRGK